MSHPEVTASSTQPVPKVIELPGAPPFREWHIECPIHGPQTVRTYMRNGLFGEPKCYICQREEGEKMARSEAIKGEALATTIALQNFFGPSIGGDDSSACFTFDRFKTSGFQHVEKAKTLCERFADRFVIRAEERELARASGDLGWRKKNSIGIFLRGPCGVGKTFLALSILNRLAQLSVPGYFVSCPSLMTAVLELPFGEKSTAIRLLCRASVLVLDDVGAQAWKPSEQQLLFQIVDGRISRGLPIIATSNLIGKQLEECLTTRTAQRLLASTVSIDAASWPNWRMARHKSLTLETFVEGF